MASGHDEQRGRDRLAAQLVDHGRQRAFHDWSVGGVDRHVYRWEYQGAVLPLWKPQVRSQGVIACGVH